MLRLPIWLQTNEALAYTTMPGNIRIVWVLIRVLQRSLHFRNRVVHTWYTYAHVYLHSHIYTCIHIYIHIYIQTYKHTHMLWADATGQGIFCLGDEGHRAQIHGTYVRLHMYGTHDPTGLDPLYCLLFIRIIGYRVLCSRRQYNLEI